MFKSKTSPINIFVMGFLALTLALKLLVLSSDLSWASEWGRIA